MDGIAARGGKPSPKAWGGDGVIMPVRVEDAKRPAHDPVLPDALTSGTLLLAELNQSGLLGKLGAGVRLATRCGWPRSESRSTWCSAG